MSQNRTTAQAITQINNERMVVTEWRFAPLAETGWHTHQRDYVVIPQTSGKLLLETQTGHQITELHTGQSYYRTAGITHNVINNNDYELIFIEVELK